MSLPAIAIAAMHLFTAVLATLTTTDLLSMGNGVWGEARPECSDRDDPYSIKNITSLEHMLRIIADSGKMGQGYYFHGLHKDYCTQVKCEENNSILYCNHPIKDDTAELVKSVYIDYNQVVQAVRYIMGNCTVAAKSGATTVNIVGGELYYFKGIASVAVTRQKCRDDGEPTNGPQGDAPITLDGDDAPHPSASTTRRHAPTTSSHSTTTSKPKSKETASPDPPTTHPKPPESTTKRPSDEDWIRTACFYDSPNKTVFSYKIVQDNIDWIAANLKAVARNSGTGNCTRLACHRNSAIFFCNDDGDEHNPLDNPDEIVAGARKVANKCRAEVAKHGILGGSSEQGDRSEYMDMIAGEIYHKDHWRVVVESSACDDGGKQGEQIIAQIPPSLTADEVEDRDTDSETKPSKTTIRAIDPLRPRTREDGFSIRGSIKAARTACPDPSPERDHLEPPPGYDRHLCWGGFRNASSPRVVYDEIMDLELVSGRPRLDPGQCERVSCMYDTAIIWCSTSTGNLELDSYGQIARAALLILDNCIVPLGSCFSGRDISGQVWYEDKWSVIVGGSDTPC